MPALLLTMAGALIAPALAVAGGLEEALQAFGVQMPSEHKPAPGFSLALAGGGSRNLRDYRGRLVLLHFWATWCAPCRKEMPQLHRLGRELAGAGLSIVCVNVDRGGEQAVLDFMQQVSPQFPTLLDPQGSVRNRYGVRALPTSYLIAGDGRIIGRVIGERDWSSRVAERLLHRLAASDGHAPAEKVRSLP